MGWREITQQADQVIDALAAVDTTTMGAAEVSAYTESVHRLHRRMDHARHDAAGRMERSGHLLDLGYHTAAQWQRHKLGRSTHHANQVMKLSRDMARLPTVSKRWAAGEVDADHARGIAKLRSPGVEEIFDEVEPHLADEAAESSFHQFRRFCRQWRIRTHPDGTDPATTDRDAHVSTTFDGAVRVDGDLDAIDGAIFKDVFDDIVEEFFQADWAEAKGRLGRKPSSAELVRTPAQRRADALTEMAHRSRAYDNHTCQRARPLVTIIAGLPALAEGLAHLWNDTPLSPAQLADILATDPDIQRFVYGPEEQPIRFNPRHRLFTGKLREAILTRDRACTGIGCDEDTRHGAVDHIHPASEGGPTAPTNGRGSCHPCNRSRPRRRFTGDTPTDPATSPTLGSTDPP